MYGVSFPWTSGCTLVNALIFPYCGVYYYGALFSLFQGQSLAHPQTARATNSYLLISESSRYDSKWAYIMLTMIVQYNFLEPTCSTKIAPSHLFLVSSYISEEKVFLCTIHCLPFTVQSYNNTSGHFLSLKIQHSILLVLPSYIEV